MNVCLFSAKCVAGVVAGNATRNHDHDITMSQRMRTQTDRDRGRDKKTERQNDRTTE